MSSAIGATFAAQGFNEPLNNFSTAVPFIAIVWIQHHMNVIADGQKHHQANLDNIWCPHCKATLRMNNRNSFGMKESVHEVCLGLNSFFRVCSWLIG